MKFVFCFLVLTATLAGMEMAHASMMIIDWNPSTSSNVAGYNVYFGTTSGNYLYKVNVGNVTSATMSFLTAGVTYYFVATAYNANGSESSRSKELKVTVPLTAVASQPVTTQTVTPPPVATRPATAVAPVTAPSTPAQSTSRSTVSSAPVIREETTGRDVASATSASVSPQIATRAATVAGRATAKTATVVAKSLATTLTAVAASAQAAANASTAPANASLVMTLGTQPRGPALISFPVQAGHSYEVQATTDLHNWSSLGQSELTTASGWMQFNDPEAAAYNTRFYRLVLH